MMNSKKVYIVFGVSGCGKTTIGKALALELGIPFYDADDFHPESNINKMKAGTPLNDDDRQPWLEALVDHIRSCCSKKGAVLACSALKQSYRETLQSDLKEHIKWIFLNGNYNLIFKRLNEREGHFFRKELLASQFGTLEKPKAGISICLTKNVDIVKSVVEIIEEIKLKFIEEELRDKIIKSQIGIIGLGVMGGNLALNVLSKGFHLSVFNRQVLGKEENVAKNFVETHANKKTSLLGFDHLSPFIDSLETPRTILIMVKSGEAVDAIINEITPLLNANDCVIDGGNSHYKDTIRRELSFDTININFLGVGISGGAEGALNGPSIMPGGSKKGYKQAKKILDAIAAKDINNTPCSAYIGPGGSGHFVKMVHNSIEYGEMQLLAEIYQLLRYVAKKSPEDIATIFENWSTRKKNSYLLEITIKILRKKDNGAYLIDKILDKTGQNGTGNWSAVEGIRAGIPIDTIIASVMARNISSRKEQRVLTSEIYRLDYKIPEVEETFINQLEEAYYVVSIINHSIGFDLLQRISERNSWELNLSEIAQIWTNGCIIRSDLMQTIALLFSEGTYQDLLLFPEIVALMKTNISSLQTSLQSGLLSGFALPVMSGAANYFFAYTTANSSANLIQAQRDFFGAHTYQRIDKSLNDFFHTDWKI
ncbi:hypothetical protein GCM10022393_26340 [Aquimarina addita]|uniref:6-phosphogluconate dehydrogenase, decarboxylating n=1 Tax=Aquimarina addita TaxID=870485 RepID=A0ABP6ULE2_9FLAO